MYDVFVVEDHPVIQRALRDLLEHEPDLRVCGLAGTVAEALESIPGSAPDIVLIDVSLPGMSGIELMMRLRAEHAGLKALLVSGYDEAHYAREALAAGALGYVLKDDPDIIIEAIRTVLTGEVYLSEQMRSQVEG